METKIGEVKGYTITYDARDKLFYLKNPEGDEVGSGKTQDDVEQQADKLAKQDFTFPVPALLRGGTYFLHLGKVTNVNLKNKSCRFVYQEKGLYLSHTKVHLSSANAYELTEHNNDIYQKVTALREQIDQLQGEIKGLMNQLEKPINLDFFGLKDDRLY